MRVRPLSLILLAAAALALACTDRREAIAREHLMEHIRSQSNGALTLTSMNKTNGFEHERDGMKLYTIEWQATIQVQADGWKTGWRDYQVLSAQPNAFEAVVESLSVRRLLRGGTVVLQGKSELQKADRGWRVLESDVTASKINAPPEIAGFIGTWHVPARDLVFRIEDDAARGLRHSVALISEDGQVSWMNTRPAQLKSGGLVVQYEEGSDTITKVSNNELLCIEEDAFGRRPQKAVRVEGGSERVMALARATSASKQRDAYGDYASSSNAATNIETPPRQVHARIGQWRLPDDLVFLSERRIDGREVAGLNKVELRHLRNFIYARHGRAFASEDLRQFFERQPWYRANPRYSDSMLSSIEVANAATIAKVENARP